MSNPQPGLTPNQPPQQQEPLPSNEGDIYRGEQRPPAQETLPLGTQEFGQEPALQGQPSVTPEGQPQVAPAVPEKSTPVTLDAESLAAITAAAQPQQPQAVDPNAQRRLEEMSADEIQKLLVDNNATPWIADKERVALLSGRDLDDVTDAQVTAFQEMYNSGVNHGLTMSSLVSTQQTGEVMARVEPLERHYSRQEQKQAFNSFYEAFPNLRQYSKAVGMAGVDLKRAIKAGQVAVPQGDAATYQALANQTISTLQELGVQVAPVDPNQQPASVVPFQPQPQQGYTSPVVSVGVPTMAVGMTPGRSQQGGVGGQPNNPDADIYGKSG